MFLHHHKLNVREDCPMQLQQLARMPAVPPLQKIISPHQLLRSACPGKAAVCTGTLPPGSVVEAGRFFGTCPISRAQSVHWCGKRVTGELYCAHLHDMGLVKQDRFGSRRPIVPCGQSEQPLLGKRWSNHQQSWLGSVTRIVGRLGNTPK